MRPDFKAVRVVVMDVDGVLTDGRVTINARGEESRVFHVRDGLGIQCMKRGGLLPAWLSARASPLVEARAREVGVEELHQNVRDKGAFIEGMAARLGVPLDAMCYIGDDLLDLGAMRKVGIPVAVADACPEVKSAAVYVTKAPGGYGAVREVAEEILSAQGVWDDIVGAYAERSS
jgi:3-deoxy-D-manno-octulosonate 8-phosphate phosphatase (KDO 8-P phosphatase)